MAFNLKKFRNTAFEPRREAVPVPDMKDFFDGGIEAVWTVRGLTGHELGKANEAAERNRNVAAILEGILSVQKKEKIESVKSMLGLDESTPRDVAKRIEMLAAGSVDPEIDHEIAVKICTCFPVEFYQLTNAITRLTGMGHMPGKAVPSGRTPA
jgi:hypothetical protein